MAEVFELSGEARADRPALERLAATVGGGGVVLIPTDTVYGLACSAEDPAALRRLYELKGRPAYKPSAVIFFSFAAALARLEPLGGRTRAALAALLPGPFTVLLANPERRWPLACEPQAALGGEPAGAPAALGVRVPRLEGRLRSLALLELPLLQSSANFSGGAEAATLAAVAPGIRAAVELALDGGRVGGKPSTVVDLSGFEADRSFAVVREGAVAAGRVAELLAGVP